VTTTRESLALKPDELRRRVDPAALPFRTTAEIEPLTGTIGQPRALAAIDFGLGIGAPGYNLFVAGAPGSGRAGTLRDYLERVARERPTPDDWVYVFNFSAPDRPNAIRLPAGRGAELAHDMEEFLRSAQREIPRAFESEDYEKRRQEIMADVGARRDAVDEELQAFAAERGFALETTPAGIVTVPLLEGRPLSPDGFARLPAEAREEVERHGREIHERVSQAVRRLRQLEKEAADRMRLLDRDVAQFALGPLLHELRDRYGALDEVLQYLGEVEEDLPDQLAAFRGTQEDLPAFLGGLHVADRTERLSRYRVNVFVGNGAPAGGAPVVAERNPTYYNLLGRIDYRASFGTMVTDFHQIRTGALGRANGGFLVLQALDVLRNPFAWDALKRALLAREIRIENLGEQLSAFPTASLRPEPVALELKVVLIGSPELYHILYALDEDFRELFKVKVDFAPHMDWSDEHVMNYAAFVSRRVRENDLHDFDSAAVARIVEHGARLRESQRKLSARLIEIADVVSEASYWADRAGREVVTAEDVSEAIARKEYRSNLLEERIQELITEGTIRVDVDGDRVGQVNALSVIDLGDYAFGKPSRVSARVSLGRGAVTSIEREIELSGPIHSKGILILSGYLAAQYAQEWPLALSATLTFEQAYEGVEGDSASSTELYALLSALSGAPLRQGVAVTGSVDQNGDVQAVGGVTTKVEGFFATCKAKGLTGGQGVIVPRANVANLMLPDEVVDAVEAGRFHVWAVETIDEGLELLTGLPAGKRGRDGAFPEGSLHRLVEERLYGYAEHMRAFGATGDADAARGG
jgi:lon-related putative ATP-dependent protease